MYERINKGTHTIQKMVDLTTLDEEEKFFEGALKGHVGKLAIDQQGTHIIQKITTSFAEINRQFAFDEITDAFHSVSKTSHGLCVIKKLVANTTVIENRNKLIEFCRKNSVELMQDPYGNYAIQEIMDKWPEQKFVPLLDNPNSILACSCNKFSSNVVEKCIKMSTVEQRDNIILQISKIDKLVTVMRNSYGNYVVQTALEMALGDTKLALADTIYENIPSIQDKKIRVKWAQLLFKEVCQDPVLSQRYELTDFLNEAGSPEPVFVQNNSPPEMGFDPHVGINHMPLQEYLTIRQNAYAPNFNQPQIHQSPMFLGLDNGFQTNDEFHIFAPFGNPPNFNNEDQD
jgi:hypothetical protein